jgi:urease accessory protein
MNSSLDQERLESSKALRKWPARLSLAFARGGPRTGFVHSEHEGPLRVQRLFHPDPDGKAHCYLLHPPGGVVLGDELCIDVAVRSGAALLTTPSAGRFYTVGTFREHQEQRVRLTVNDAGLLEWLPQESIVFSGADARLSTCVDLARGGRLAFWDILVLGRPACGERFTTGRCLQQLAIRRDGRLLLRESLALQAGDRMSSSPVGLRGASTVGLAVFTATLERDRAEDWLALVNGPGLTGEFSITQRGELLLARYLGEQAQVARAGFSLLWRRVGLTRDGAEPSEPRIWHT